MNKAFTLIEALIVIIIISLFNLLTIKSYNYDSLFSKFNVENVKYNLVENKFNSLLHRERNCLDNSLIKNSINICFNQKGNVSQAITLEIINSKDQIVIFLGAGIYEFKKR